MLKLLRRRRCTEAVNFAVSNCQYAKRLTAHGFHSCFRCGNVASYTFFSKHVKRAFYDCNVFAVNTVYRSHKLAIGIKRYFGKSRILCVEFLPRHAVFMRRKNNGCFSRVTDMANLAIFQFYISITAKRTVF